MHVNIGTTQIENTQNEKLLGITIDCKLIFDKHVQQICSRESAKLKALAKIAPFMNNKKRKISMNAFSNAQFSYCPLTWMFQTTVSNDVKNYLQFCIMFGLSQISKSPTRITYSSTSLVDHILASLPDRISREGVTNVSLSDHQLICCTRKISRIKTAGVHNKIKFRSLKNYAVDAYKNALREINFPNYEYPEDANRAYSDFF